MAAATTSIMKTPHKLILLGIAALLTFGSMQRAQASPDGYWDHHGHWQHYTTYHHHRGYWDERNGTRIFISL